MLPTIRRRKESITLFLFYFKQLTRGSAENSRRPPPYLPLTSKFLLKSGSQLHVTHGSRVVAWRVCMALKHLLAAWVSRTKKDVSSKESTSQEMEHEICNVKLSRNNRSTIKKAFLKYVNPSHVLNRPRS